MPHQTSDRTQDRKLTAFRYQFTCQPYRNLTTLKIFIDFDFDPFRHQRLECCYFALGGQIPLSHARFCMIPTVAEIIAIVKYCVVV